MSSLKRLLGQTGNGGAGPPAAPRTTTYASDTGLVEITAPAAASTGDAARTLSDLEQTHHQFITSNWAKLAAAAYAGFRRHGIGVVVIEERSSDGAASVAEAFDTHHLAYATGMGMWTQHPPHSAAPDWLDEQFQTYEPLEAGLFLFRSRSGEKQTAAPRPYHAAGTPAPPDALKQARAPFN